jgi:exodeoxyribonuclease VIII
MADLMIDLEGLGTGPDTTILTIAAQSFDPLGTGYHQRHYYARIDLESQSARSIQQDTIDWWATQPAAARDEAFNEADRIPLDQALDELGKLIWQSKRIWAQGPTYDMNILEHAYKSYSKPLPWLFYVVRDSRTVFGLWPELPKPPTSHHALEDCRRQIAMLQTTLQHLNVKELA